MAERDKIAIGIDLGTTFCAASVFRNGHVDPIPLDSGQYTFPSHVAFSGSSILYGRAAKNHGLTNPEQDLFDSKRMIGKTFSHPDIQSDQQIWPFRIRNGIPLPKYVVQTPTGEREFAPVNITSMILKRIKASIDAFLNMETCDVVITVPAYFGHTQREETLKAAKAAGFNVLRLISEPTAAALAYKLNQISRTPQNVIVFDYGGGTFDVSVLEIDSGHVTVKAVNGNNHLGGQDIDNILIDHLAEVFRKQTGISVHDNKKVRAKLRKESENAKIFLSSPEVQFAPIDIDNLYQMHSFEYDLTREEFNAKCEEQFQRCMVCVQAALEDATFDKNQINKVILVGGSSNIIRVREILAEFFGSSKLSYEVDGSRAVADGAAIQAYLIQDAGDALLGITDVIPHSLGVGTVGDKMSIILHRNEKRPCTNDEPFTNAYDDQTSAIFAIYEGESTIASENTLLGSVTIPIQKSRAKEADLRAEFRYDDNGTLHVRVKDVKTDRVQLLDIERERLSQDADIREDVAHIAQIRMLENTEEERQKARNEVMRVLHEVETVLTDRFTLTDVEDLDTIRADFDLLDRWAHSESRSSPYSKTELDVKLKELRSLQSTIEMKKRDAARKKEEEKRLKEAEENRRREQDEAEMKRKWDEEQRALKQCKAEEKAKYEEELRLLREENRQREQRLVRQMRELQERNALETKQRQLEVEQMKLMVQQMLEKLNTSNKNETHQ